MRTSSWQVRTVTSHNLLDNSLDFIPPTALTDFRVEAKFSNAEQQVSEYYGEAHSCLGIVSFQSNHVQHTRYSLYNNYSTSGLCMH